MVRIIILLFFGISFAQKIKDSESILITDLIPHKISNPNFDDDISSSFSYFFTENKNETFKNVLQNNKKFSKNYSLFNSKKLTNLTKDGWFIGKIQNTTKDTLDFVFITSNSQKVEVYIISNTDTINKRIGYIQDSDKKYSKEKSNAFNDKLLPYETKIILLHQRVFSIYDLIFKFNISSASQYDKYLLKSYRKLQGNRMFLGILSGGILLLFLFNIMLYFNTKIKYYIFYSIYLLLVFVYIILMLDRNQNFFADKIMLYFELIKEVSYTLSIVFYGYFVKSILEISDKKVLNFVKIFTTITFTYIIFLIYIFFKQEYNFTDLNFILIKFFKIISFGFISVLIYQLYKKSNIKYIKFIFIGSIILISAYALQLFFDAYHTVLFSKQFSKIFVRPNSSILLGTVIEILFFSYALHLKSYKVAIDKKVLENLNQLKSDFFANISHEFRTPLTLIKSPIQSLKAEIKNVDQINKLNLIDKNSIRMLELVDQLLELSKLDSGKLKLIFKEGNIASFLNALLELFSYQAKEKNIIFTSKIENDITNYHFDKDVIEKIVTNLVSNALKYTSENEKIIFESKIEYNQLQILVSNSGSKIKKADLSKIFERFYQKSNSNQGVGIGLALVKELVGLYKGKIVTNIDNGVLSFTVYLPLEKVNENAIIVDKEASKTIISYEEKNENELPILLIVDDNEDIRTVLKDLFKSKYQILEAEDGEKALKIAKKEIPDCIITDVMMPNIDGFEFTRLIKNDELTSFIPVILLTAKSSDEAHLEGLNCTADAYLTKPFNNKIIIATVKQLILERKKLHLRYSQELVLRPVDIVINSVDEKFLEKLQQILNKELSNSEFSSDNFAVSVGMSRMQLHRKLKSLLGVSSTEFFRNERLKTAKVLLEKANGNISEIAYSVGFNDVSYFSKCFKEVYNITPSELLNKNKTS